jgi:hypothetical protein
MLRLVSIVVLCVLLVPSLLSASSDVWIGRAGAGLAGEVASVVVVGTGVAVYALSSHVNWSDELAPLGLAVLGLVALVPVMPVTTAAGVCMAGHAQGLDGHYWAAYLGGLAGTAICGGVVELANVATQHSSSAGVPLVVAGALMPAVGATVGYDLSRSRGVESDVWQERLIPPTVAIVPMHRNGRERATRIDAKLLTIRF